MKFDQFITSTSVGLPNGVSVSYDKKVFKNMVDFIISLQPEQLSQSQTTKIIDIISSFDMVPEGEEYVEETTMINLNRNKMIEWYKKYKEYLDIHKDMNKGWNRII